MNKTYSIFTKRCLLYAAAFLFISCASMQEAFSQAEVAAWGNMKGIRVDGQLMEFETSMRVVSEDWSQITATGKERQRPKYDREGRNQVVTTRIDSVYLKETVEDTGTGQAKVTVQATSRADTSIAGVFFSVALPGTEFSERSVQLINPIGQPQNPQTTGGAQELMRGTASGVKLMTSSRQMEILFSEPTVVILTKGSTDNPKDLQLYMPVHLGTMKQGQVAEKTFLLKATGQIDKKPITLKLNTAETGRAFAGIGGNFRLQNPKIDAQVIDYSLQNLRVAWGRVEMPWRFWQPELKSDPIKDAKAGKLHPHVQKSMEMAQRLAKRNIPVILSAWSGPAWAVVGEPKFRPGPDGVWGNPLAETNMNAIYKSIADYIVYLRDAYGVEVHMFSFNESDLGINIRQTPEEHAALIRGLGAYFVTRGLKTKLLLGDNSDANSFAFIYPAMEDPKAQPYIGALSFHSWRGWEKETLQKWADAATKLNLPLIVGEGSIDAAAWNYPEIFEEETYAREEINLYTRILAICQPLTILQWQLTADYSPLSGGGIFGDDSPLRPTQRFWNLKQLGATPEGLLAMPITADRPNVSCAALGDNGKGTYAVHLVNNGATREVNLTGLPVKVKSLRLFVTDKTRDMREGQRISVTNGQARFTLDTGSFTSLMTELADAPQAPTGSK